MASIASLALLLCIYAVCEIIAQKSKAVVSTVLGIAVLLLIGFWTGILPSTIIQDAEIDKFGNVVAGLLIVSLGTTIDFPEIKRQWKVVVSSLIEVIGAVAAIILIGGLIVDKSTAIAGAPIFAGGSAATLIMTAALQEKGLQTASTFCVVLYVTQKFIGIPISSLLLRKEAGAFLKDENAVNTYSQIEDTSADGQAKQKAIKLPKSFDRPSVYLAKLAVVATIAFYGAKLTNGIVHYFVMCLIMGVIFFALGFLDRNILAKTQASSLITFLTTLIIFANLATTTPQQVVEVFGTLIVTALCGVAGIAVTSLVCSKLFNLSFRLAFSLGLTCTFGFPTTMLMPKEIAEAISTNEKERAAIENYLLPKMLTAGFVTVTIASVVIAGVVVNML